MAPNEGKPRREEIDDPDIPRWEPEEEPDKLPDRTPEKEPDKVPA
jgi:hypothetical protein